MLSFSQCVALLSEAVKLEKHKTNNSEEHHAEIGNHSLKINYHVDRYYNDEAKNYHPIPHHYSLSFELNGRHDRRRVAGEKKPTPEENLSIYHHVVQSVSEFVNDKNPKRLSFYGDSKYKHKHWGRMGPLLARKLGGKFTKGNEHRIDFEKNQGYNQGYKKDD
jgi:hypothetical protein